MPGLKQTVLGLVGDGDFPLRKGRLLDLAEGVALDPESLAMLTALDDDEFADADALAERLDDALGVPDADLHHSALEARTTWRS